MIMTNVYTELYSCPSTITTLISFYPPNNTKKRIFILQLTEGLRKLDNWGFLGGAVVKNPPANAGDTGSSPGLGRSHMPWSN